MSGEAAMAFVSLTRLRIRSIRFMAGFAWHAIRSRSQVMRAPGFLTGALLPDRSLTFWTMTVWESEQSMRGYMTAGAHKEAMTHLMYWCDEASVTHWQQAEARLPTWEEADRRMRASGRPSKVRFPSARHADLSYQAPRTAGSVPMQPS